MAKKRLFDENGNEVKGRIKKPIYKKWWFWLLILIVVGSALSGGDEDKSEATKQPEQISVSNEKVESISLTSESEVSEISKIIEESAEVESVESTEKISSEPEPEVSREYKNALGSAKQYLNYTNFSKIGLYDQLIYEEYPEDASQYAIENVDTDWNENALGAAIQYLDYSSFSDQGLYDQLIYEGYTEEQAQYAIDNLPE